MPNVLVMYKSLWKRKTDNTSWDIKNHFKKESNAKLSVDPSEQNTFQSVKKCFSFVSQIYITGDLADNIYKLKGWISIFKFRKPNLINGETEFQYSQDKAI